ncbi:Paraquat-inducible protein A [Pelomyxa schiedti]|nr:Paraquat-inducible protein A [Pelomyxa schiedti]
MRYLPCCLLCLLLVSCTPQVLSQSSSSTSPSQGEADSSSPSWCASSLESWISDITLYWEGNTNLVDTDFLARHYLLNATNMTLHDISVSSLSAVLNPQQSSESTSTSAGTNSATSLGFGFSLSGVQLSFEAIWTIIETTTDGLSVLYNSTFPAVLNVTNSTDNEVYLAFQIQNDGVLAQNLTLTDCQVNINFTLYLPNSTSYVELLSTALALFLCDEIDDFVIETLAPLIDSINSFISPYTSMPPDPLMVPEPLPTANNLTENAFINAVDWFLNVEVGANGPLGLNPIMNVLTNYTGVLNIDMDSDGDIFQMQSLTLGGLNTFTNTTTLFVPIDNVTLDTQLILESVDVDLSFLLTVNLTSLIDSSSLLPSANLCENAIFAFSLAEPDLTALMQFAWYIAYLATNWTDPMCLDFDCILSSIGANDTAFTSAYTDMSTSFSFIMSFNDSGTQTLEHDVSEAITMVGGAFLEMFPVYVPSTVTAILYALLLPFLNSKMSEYFENQTCPYTADVTDPQEEIDVLTTSLAFSLAVVFAVGIFLAAEAIHWRKNRKAKEANANETTALVSDTTPVDNSEGGSGTPKKPQEVPKSNYTGSSLILHPHLHWIIRFGMFLAVCANFAIFICSGSTGGTEVYLSLNTGTRIIDSDPLMIFTLESSVTDMWEAGLWPIAIIVALFSGVWPRLKIILMGAAWVVPVYFLSTKRRELGIMALDALGKWSLVDSFMMIIMMVAFRFSVAFPLYEVENVYIKQPFTIDVYVLMLAGFIIFLMGTMVSLLLSHLIVAAHRLAESLAKSKGEEEDSKVESLFMHVIRHGPRRRKHIRVAYTIGVAVVLCGTFVVMILAFRIDSFSFHFGGLAGWLLEEIGLSATRTFSIVTLAYAIPSTSTESDPWIWVVTLVYACTCIFFPLIQIILLFILWMTPLPRIVQKIGLIVAEVLNAWSALEVFFLAICTSLLQLEQFAAFLVDDACASIDVFLEQYMSGLLEGDATCFTVNTELLAGAWLLLAGSISYMVTAWIVMRACHRVINREDFERGSCNCSCCWGFCSKCTRGGHKSDGESEPSDTDTDTGDHKATI